MALKTNLFTFLLASSALTIGVAGPAHAQTPVRVDTSGPSPSDPDLQGEEIVVTAQQRQMLSRDVPGSVSVLGNELLNEARINNLQDAVRLAPNVELGVSNPPSVFPVIRGIAPQTTGGPTVAVLQDGFGFGEVTSALQADIFDVGRIEILKGPQATLYGQNSLGGVINILSNRPSLRDFEGDFRASYGEYDSTQIRGAVSIPIVNDQMAIRAGAYLNARDGYWDNLFNGREGQDAQREIGARFAARLRPSSAFDSFLVYSFSRLRRDCGDCSNPILGYNPADPTSIGQNRIDTDNLGEFVNENIPGYQRATVHRITWNNELHLGHVILTSLTGYGTVHDRALIDADRGPGNTLSIIRAFFLDNETNVFSQELRAASDGSGRLNWLIGAFYRSTETDAILNFQTAGADIPSTNSKTNATSYALFTNNTFHISDRFDIQFGLRYDHAETTTRNNLNGIATPTTSHAWLPKASLLYRLDGHNNIYATVSRGYRPGGSNAGRLNVPANLLEIKPEFIWNYEVGLRGVSADGRLRYDFAAYLINWTDQQIQQNIGVIAYIANAGRTRIYGAEAALHYNVTSNLSFDASVAYNHARYLDFTDPTTKPVFFGFNPDRSGQRPFMAPDWSASIAGRYVLPIGGGFDVTFAGDARYSSERSLDVLAAVTGGGYVLANLSVSLGDEHKRLTLFANNAFDRRYSTALLLLAGIPPITHLGAPRVIGIQADFRF